MKKFNLLILTFIALTGISCSHYLDTEPTSEVSGEKMENAEGLEVALNGIYASMYNRIDFVTANTHQCFGNEAVTLAAELMGEDMVQTAKGPGWFWHDYTYENRERYASKIWRCYFTWKYFYELINNANAILDHQTTASGDSTEIENIMGQAYAVRAFSYFMLIQSFQQTYIGHESSPGVPVYTTATTSSSGYKGRGTVQETYDRITADLTQALYLLKKCGISQEHISHLDYYATSLLQARVALVMNDRQTALTAANNAISKTSCTLLTRSEATVVKGTYSSSSWTTGTTPFNSVSSPDVMWGAEIIPSQSRVYASFFSQMDACTNVYYAAETPKCISNWLYAQIPDSDIRKGWWNGNIGIPASKWGYGANINYNQHKFQWKDQKALTGDYIFMRLEEAYLIKAEALCQLHKYAEARTELSELGSRRDSNFASRLSLRTDSDEQTFGSVGTPKTLMDEILLQRRIELWGEAGRIFDIQRLRHTWTREWTINGEESNHTDKLTKYAEYQAFPSDYIECILMIPQAELDINPLINQEDQNPYVN